MSTFNCTPHDPREVHLAERDEYIPIVLLTIRVRFIIADYNREKDRATVEQTFAALLMLAEGLDEEDHRAVEEGLSEDELAIFDLLKRESLTKADRERVKQASRSLLAPSASFSFL